MKNQPLDQPANDLPEKLSNPARRALAGARIQRLEELTRLTEEQVKKLHGIGPNAIAQLKSALGARGLTFAQEERKDYSHR